jgi:hypothetical protein
MSLHPIIEPAGTLATGWKLVPHEPAPNADLRHPDEIPSDDVESGDRTIAPDLGDHLVTVPATRSKWEMGEVG